MTTTALERDGYVLGRNAEEYERLRAQARSWNRATGRLLDELGLPSGSRCLDAGCGPGETMRLMAERVGPAGSVLGVDVDAALGAATREALQREGHGQCEFLAHDLTEDVPIPGAPFDLVYARLLLFHLPQRGDLVSLEPKTLKVKDVYRAGQEFTSTPVTFQFKDKTMVAATTKDGRIHLIDGNAMGGAAVKSAPYSSASDFTPGALLVV